MVTTNKASSTKNGIPVVDKGVCSKYGSKLQITLHGMVTVCPKGQVVIPASVRREIGIEVGDQLMVIVKYGKVAGFFKANMIEELHTAVTNEIKNFKQNI